MLKITGKETINNGNYLAISYSIKIKNSQLYSGIAWADVVTCNPELETKNLRFMFSLRYFQK